MKVAEISPKDIGAYIARNKKTVDREIIRILRSIQPRTFLPKNFKESTLHSVLEGGKRIRPLLAIATYEACGGVGSAITAPASSVELIHAGSLILDDLPCMDNADMRRGKPTTHKLYGESTTILVSAALWAAAFEMVSTTHSKGITELIHKMALTIGGRGLIQGQMLDLESFNSVQHIKDLEECYRLKTGVLFSLAMYAGAVMADADESTQKTFTLIGEQLGVAFQIRDDIFDATKSLVEMGKDPHLDAKNHKPNYVSLLGLAGAQKELIIKQSNIQSLLSSLSCNTSMLSALVKTILAV